MLSNLEPDRAALLKAADYMREHGHCVGKRKDRKGRVCMVGAIMATPKTEAYLAAEVRLRKYVDCSIPRWSDTHTEAECIAALEGAALAP